MNGETMKGKLEEKKEKSDMDTEAKFDGPI